jgi:HEAT repeat protein
MGHVFIAYDEDEAAFAANVTRQLQDAGFRVWSDNDQLRQDGEWREAIDEAIRDAFVLIVVLTPEASESDLVMYEWMFALGGGVEVIPVVRVPTDLHPRLEALQTLDFADTEQMPWGKLIRQVQQAYNSTRSPFRAPRRERPSPPGRERPTGPPSQRPSTGGLFDRVRRRESQEDDKLGDIDPRQSDAVPRLIEALESDSRDTRATAARRLAEMKERAAIPTLMKLLRDDDWRVREAAAVALGKLKAAGAVRGMLETLRYGRPGPFGGGNHAVILGAIREIGPPAVPVLIDALNDSDWRIRLHAIDVLGQINALEAIPDLIAALYDTEKRVRWRASDALGEMGCVEAVPALLDLLNDRVDEVRITAASALGRIGHREGIVGLLKLLHDNDWRARWAAAEALWAIGAPAVPALAEKLYERDPSIRRAATRALAEIGAPAVTALVAALDGSNWDMRSAAVTALQQIGAPAVPALVAVLADGDWRARWAAVEALRVIGTPEAQAAVAAWEDEDPPHEDQPDVISEQEDAKKD